MAGAAERFPTFWRSDRRGWTGSLAAEAASGPPHDFPLFAHRIVSLACSAFDPLSGSHPENKSPMPHFPVDELSAISYIPVTNTDRQEPTT